MANILLVDDGALITSWLSEILRREHYNVETARNEEEAVRLYNKEVHDLIVTDLRMPEGLDMIAELLSRHPKTRLLAIIGGELIPPDSLLNTASVFGFLRILRKPFSLETFLQTVASQLAQAPEGD